MAFHEINSVTDINVGHRVIIYYIENKCNDDINPSKLHKTLEAAMRTLEKKNDDVLVVKLLSESEEFTKFQQLYKAEVKGQVTLFVVNNEGIPIVSQHVLENEEPFVFAIISTICSFCELNPVPAVNLFVKSDSKLCSTITDNLNRKQKSISADTMSQKELRRAEKNRFTGSNNSEMESPPQSENGFVDSQPSRTQLQIRLPDGSRHKQQFDKEAMLNEVRVFISTQYKLQNFDLKTYNHKSFVEDEYDNTLKDLDLYPNGVVIVVPKLGVSVYNRPNGWIGSMFRYGLYQLVSKTTNTMGYIQGLLIIFWNRAKMFFSNNGPTNDNNIRRKRIQSNSDQSDSQKRSKSTTKSYGNVHTLRRNDDSDDENNRYNGNSTQQK